MTQNTLTYSTAVQVLWIVCLTPSTQTAGVSTESDESELTELNGQESEGSEVPVVAGEVSCPATHSKVKSPGAPTLGAVSSFKKITWSPSAILAQEL